MIHYHGTPITPRSELQKLAGKSFCVSYAHRQDADWCLAHGQSVMWDNGAFTAHTKGRAFDERGFIEWLEPRLGPPHWAVVPDRIGGSVEEQREMIARWRIDRFLSAPVWHMALPVDWLLELADGWPRICFGSSPEAWVVGSPAWERLADRAFNELERRGLRPWVHMLRGLSLCGDKWPFASADSVNVGRNYKCDGVCPERMARRIDAIQCPVKWHIRSEQGELI